VQQVAHLRPQHVLPLPVRAIPAQHNTSDTHVRQDATPVVICCHYMHWHQALRMLHVLGSLQGQCNISAKRFFSFWLNCCWYHQVLLCCGCNRPGWLAGLCTHTM
jgi:hypothetical protein